MTPERYRQGLKFNLKKITKKIMKTQISIKNFINLKKELSKRQNLSVWKPLQGSRGGKVMSISEDTHSYIIGVSCEN